MPDFDPATLPLHDAQLIEASAGTGKTHAITDLCLRLLLDFDNHLQRPLAINEILILTFTRAATDELRHRVSTRIEEARRAFRTGATGEEDTFLRQLVENSADKQRDLKLLTAAVQLMDEASIFTIHSFCAKILGEQAFESGVLFNQEMNAARDTLLKQAAEDCFRTQIMSIDPEMRQLALYLWRSPEALANKLQPMLFRGKLHYYSPSVSLSTEELLQKARRAKTLWRENNLEALIKDRLNARYKPGKRLAKMAAFCRSDQVDLANELWDIYNQTSLTSALKKNAVRPTHEALDLIDEVSRALPGQKAALWRRMLDEVTRLMQEHKAQWHKLTIDDLLTQTATAVAREGSALPEIIANRWPAAMIDEFQDTDSIQNTIFSTVYQRPFKGCLLMIGDPKQAIYNFRGADIFSYINARRQAEGHYTLKTNWRSSPAMIAATNLLFDKPEIFGNDKDIPFQPVDPTPQHTDMKMMLDGHECTPYQLFAVGDASRFLPLEEMRRGVMAYAAEQTAGLIGDPSLASLKGEPIKAGQIAFLVRSRKDAQVAQKALTERNIQSVYLTQESVFLQDTADDLKLILRAVAKPANESAIRAALGTGLMQVSAEEIDALDQDLALQQKVMSEFQDYHRLWMEQDLAPMLNELARRRQLAKKWLHQPGGERQLTNLRHLTGILQQRSAEFPGMYQLIRWFSQQQHQEQYRTDGISGEERQLRLESDENLVKIITMHGSKGLEYDIVMIPMPSFSSPSGDGPALFHEERQGQFTACLELGDNEQHRRHSMQEQLDEDMRLLYVALTRARYRCYLGLPKTSGFNGSAFARLLGIEKIHKDESLSKRARDTLPASLFELVDGNDPDKTTYEPRQAKQTLTQPPAPPPLPDAWRIHSYSGMVAGRSRQDQVPVAGFNDDDRDEAGPAATSERNKFSFPRGMHVGHALHALMENLDFKDSSDHQVRCENTLQRLGLDKDWLPVMQRWLSDILNTPFNDGDFSLGSLSREDRLDEMEFHFPVSSSADVLQYLAGENYIAGDEISTTRLQGMMTGFIDLVFRRDGRYFLADYKSNHLGRRPEDYTDDKLNAAMTSHQYHLQYVVYTLAVHKMLQHKLPGYQYEQHFGGAYYFFLRGMDGGNQSGVFFARPAVQFIDRLDKLLSGDGQGDGQ